MKYWVCKRAPAHAAEALEALGGNGFVEDSGLPLLYRDAPPFLWVSAGTSRPFTGRTEPRLVWWTDVANATTKRMC